ncbi:MAG: type II toxin-antitoxin system VapC family toxin [Terracidiphilus sp.]
MILDTSAIVAILQYEPEAAAFARAVEDNRPVRVSAATWLESAVVVDGNRSPALSRRFNEFLREAGVEIEPVTARQAELAREAYRAFGRGSGHPAHLNFGDCFAYALAMERDEALLFKGKDFASTDVRRVGTA